MTFQLIDIILFLGISQGLFLATSLGLIRERNKSANKILSIILGIAVLMLFGRVAVFRVEAHWIYRLGTLADTTILLFGPLLYCYVRRLLFREQPSYRLGWMHYIPLGIYLVYLFWSFITPIEQFNTYYATGSLNLIFFLTEITGLLSLIGYIIASFYTLRMYRQRESELLSYHQQVYRFSMFILSALSIFAILWLFSFISANFLKTFYRYINYNMMWISTPLFIYVVGYFSLRQPEIFRLPLPAKNADKRARLKPDEIQKLQKRLNFFMQEEHLYLQADLTLKDLSEKLNTTPNDLSWLLNQVYQQSFYDFINGYRVAAFLKKIDANAHHSHTLLGLALDVGFNSKSTFNKAFKTLLGCTPSAYIKRKQVA